MCNVDEMTKKSIFIFLACLSTVTFTAQKKISEIKLDFKHYKWPDQSFNLKAFRMGKQFYLKRVDNKKDTTFVISKSDFDTLANAARRISHVDIINNLDLVGADGTSCEITFGNFSNSVSYKIWSPDYKTDKRKLADFLSVCKLFVKTALLNPKSVFLDEPSDKTSDD